MHVSTRNGVLQHVLQLTDHAGFESARAIGVSARDVQLTDRIGFNERQRLRLRGKQCASPYLVSHRSTFRMCVSEAAPVRARMSCSSPKNLMHTWPANGLLHQRQTTSRCILALPRTTFC
ncbi:hypothetical protein [Burkholderia stabilis]|uniref:hypothetical protein n=1 Tax=Burkholderia stabilis TaxID=95485 RepID=UPI0013CF04CA|nr:hypothetical protein [Burkholderia stabilis]